MPTSLGPAEIMVVLLVALIVLGPSRLPEAGRQIGKALAEMRRWSGRLQEEVRNTLDAEPEPTASAPPRAEPSPPGELPRPDQQPPA
jgi:Tat protein translocase TatB subunit